MTPTAVTSQQIAVDDPPSDLQQLANELVSDDAKMAFYTAVCDQKDLTDLQKLMEQGLFGKKLPQPLKGQKAANAFQQAFELIGGVPRLALWADKNPSAFFALYSKMIPSTIKAEVDTTLRIELKYSNPAFNQQDAINAAPSGVAFNQQVIDVAETVDAKQ